MTQHTPREKHLPQLPSALGTPEMHQTCQELIRRHGNKPERNYVELTLGTSVWVQHRQNATWEPATVISQSAPNSYCIVQDNGAEQPKVYRCSMHMLKIRYSPTNGKQNVHARQCVVENKKLSFTSQPDPMGTETSWQKILLKTTTKTVSNHHCPHWTFQLLEIFQKTGRKASL